MSVVRFFPVYASALFLAFTSGAVELPEGVKVAKDGALTFSGGSVGVWVAQAGWMGAVNFARADPIEKDGRFVVAGDCNLSAIKGYYEYLFTPTSKTALEASWTYRMDAPIDTAVSCAAISVNHADVKGAFLDGVYRPIPFAAGKEYTFHPKELSFVLEGGRTLTVRHGNVHYIDNRRFGNDSSGFRLLMNVPSGRVTENALKVGIEFGDVPQTAGSLDGQTVHSPVEEIVGSGVVTNGGVRFVCRGQVFEAPITLMVPKDRVVYGLSILHGTDGVLKDGELVGRIEALYADGSVRTSDVVYGEDIGSWQGLHDLKNAKPTVQKWNIVRFDGLYASHFPLKVADPVSVTLKPMKGKWLVAAATFTAAPVSFKTYSNKPITITEGKDWQKLEFTGRTVTGSALDFSSFSDRPAGSEGYVEVGPSGAFRLAGSGREIRFNGANLCGSPLIADATNVEEMVSRMKACGLNAIRFHHYERELLGPSAKNGLDFDPDRLDRFQRTWAICATNGLYITYDIYASREVWPGEIAGVTKKHGLGVYKAMLPISRAYVENLKDFCRRFLLRKNPYTGVRIADDPAVMGVNIVNEDDIGFYWLGAKDAWAAAYTEHCKVHAGLNPKVGQSNPDFQRFLYEKQAAFHREMVDFCRNEIGIKAPLTSMNMTDRLDLTTISANFDWVDKHCYYSHPNKLDPKQGALVPNAYSQTGSPIESFASPAPRQIAISRYLGKPMGSTEYNFCYPNQYRHEGIPVFMAYAAYQGWNSFFRFMWSCGPWSLNKPFYAVPFEEAADPIMQLSDRIAAALFLRGDLEVVKRGYVLDCSPSNLATAQRMDISLLETVAGFAVTACGETPPVGWKALASLESLDRDDAAALKVAREKRRAITPDGQIDLDAENHTLRIVTPKTEVLSAGRGDLKGAVLSLSSIRGFQTLAAISLDGKPLLETGHAVLIHLPDIQNSGVKFNNELKTVQMNWGELPYLVHRVSGTVVFKAAHPFKVTALSGDGRPLGTVLTTFAEGTVRFAVDPTAFAGGALAYDIEALKK